MEGAVEGSIGVLWQVQVGLGSVVMTTDTLFQDGRGLPVILHDNLRSKQQYKTSNPSQWNLTEAFTTGNEPLAVRVELLIKA